MQSSTATTTPAIATTVTTGTVEAAPAAAPASATATLEAKSPINKYALSNLIAHDEENNRLMSSQMSKMNNDDAIDDIAKSLSKNEIIKRFDNKFKNEAVATVTACDNTKNMEKFDDALVIDNVDVIDNNTNIDDDDDLNEDELLPVDVHANAMPAKNGHDNGRNAQVPPKPLPRTSRNNSVSSDQGFVMVGDEIQLRPVAKPRNMATTSYKVHLLFHHTLHKSSFCYHQQFDFKNIATIFFSHFFFFCSLIVC